MRCGRVRALLPLLLDGRLPACDEREVQDHVRSCGRCARIVSKVTLPLPPVPPLPERLLETMHVELDSVLEARIRRLSCAGWEGGGGMHEGTRPRSSPLSWVSGVLVGAAASWFVLFLVPELGPSHRASGPAAGDVGVLPGAPATVAGLEPAPSPVAEFVAPSGYRASVPPVRCYPATFFISGGNRSLLGLHQPRPPWRSGSRSYLEVSTPEWLEFTPARAATLPQSE